MKHVQTFLLIVFCNITLAQQIGSKVSFLGADGRIQTGEIKSIWFKHFKVKYDGSQAESWLDANQLTVLENSNTAITSNSINTSFSNKINLPVSKDSVLLPNKKISSVITKDTKTNDVIGTKISVLGTDGKTYTGTITDSYGDSYKVKYDGFEDETWADKSVFYLVSTSTKTTANQPTQAVLKKSDKVEFDLYGDGSKWVNGTILLVNEAKTAGCLMYKIRYVYDASHIYTFTRNCKQVRLLNTASAKINPAINDTITKLKIPSVIDTSLVGEYRCYQAVWEYNTKTNGWEGRGMITLNANGTFQLSDNGSSGRYQWDSFKNEIKFHDGLEGAIAIPTIKAKNTEIKIQFETAPAKTWSCSTHRE